jgi:hypothetical protein
MPAPALLSPYSGEASVGGRAHSLRAYMADLLADVHSTTPRC